MTEWLQSIEGILTLSIGGMTIGAIVANVVTSIKNVTNGKKIMDLEKVLDKSNKALEKNVETNEQLAEKSKEKDEVILHMELEKIQENETMKLILTALSYIVSASGGIDDVTKIQLLTEMNKAKEVIDKKHQEAKEYMNLKKEEVIKELANKKEEALEKSAEAATQFLSGAQDKIVSLVEKHTRK